MKATILSFGYSNNYAIPEEFDLNVLKKLLRVKEKGEVFIPEEDEDITIKVGKKITLEEKEIEAVNIKEIKQDKENYSRWWREEQAKVKKLEEELLCKKLEIEEFKKEKPNE